MPSLRRHFLPGEKKAVTGPRYDSPTERVGCISHVVSAERKRPTGEWPAERVR
jgi:hypothetical protein